MVLVPQHPWHRLSLRERLAAAVTRRWREVRVQAAAWRRHPANELRQLCERGRAAAMLLLKGRPRHH